jgi:hypothetical protein
VVIKNTGSGKVVTVRPFDVLQAEKELTLLVAVVLQTKELKRSILELYSGAAGADNGAE